MKRQDYISWDEYFMGVAMLAARRSKDPNTQVGACIVSQDNIIISTGYNGMPKGCSDDEFPWDREGEQTKYPYVVHAELNAILNANGRDLSPVSPVSYRPPLKSISRSSTLCRDITGEEEILAAATLLAQDVGSKSYCLCGKKIKRKSMYF